MAKEDIIRKVQALLNKTEEQGATKAEAESSLQLATKLMAQYMIEEHELQSKDDTFTHRKVYVYTFRVPEFNYIADALASLFECRFIYYTHHRRKGEILYGEFFGYHNDVELCCYYWDMLKEVLLRDTSNFRKSDIYKELMGQGFSRDPLTAFQLGWTQEILSKIFVMQADKKKDIQETTGTDLVVVKQEETNNYVDEFFKDEPLTGFRQPHSTFVNSDECKEAGKEAARQVEFNPGLEGEQEKLENEV